MVDIRWTRRALMIKNKFEPVKVADAILDFQSRLERLETKYNIPFKHKWNYQLLLVGRKLQQNQVTLALLEFQKRIGVLREVMLTNVDITLHTIKGDTNIGDVTVVINNTNYVSDNNGLINITGIREGIYRVHAKKGKNLRGVEYIQVMENESNSFTINLKVTR